MAIRPGQLVARTSFPGLFSRPANLLLPRQTSWDLVTTSLQGAWTLFSHQSAFEDAVKKNIIRKSILDQAKNGPFVTMALFQNLQNPLLKESQFDAEEFVQVVGPALENFHEVLWKLGNELPSLQTKEVKLTPDNAGTIFTVDSLFGANLWREQADGDPDSLAGRLAKMTTKDAFEAFFYSAKLVLLGDPTAHRTTVESCEIGEVALLNARAMVMDQGNENERLDEDNLSPNRKKIAAQMDVLYEITHTYKQPRMPIGEIYRDVVGDADNLNNATVDNNSSNSGINAEVGENSSAARNAADSSNEVKDSTQYETIMITTLGVAALEGWLKGDPEGKDLRWKVALVRDANEFGHVPSVVKIS